MLRKEIITILLALMLFMVCPVRADIVEVNLFDLGCPTEFNWDAQYWQTDFDLGSRIRGDRQRIYGLVWRDYRGAGNKV